MNGMRPQEQAQYGFRGVLIGEASNPGPPASVESARILDALEVDLQRHSSTVRDVSSEDDQPLVSDQRARHDITVASTIPISGACPANRFFLLSDNSEMEGQCQSDLLSRELYSSSAGLSSTCL